VRENTPKWKRVSKIKMDSKRNRFIVAFLIFASGTMMLLYANYFQFMIVELSVIGAILIILGLALIWYNEKSR